MYNLPKRNCWNIEIPMVSPGPMDRGSNFQKSKAMAYFSLFFISVTSARHFLGNDFNILKSFTQRRSC